MGSQIPKEKLRSYREVCERKFDDKEIRHMWKLYHSAAPDGRMQMPQFKKYIEEVLPHQGQLDHFGVKIDPEDPRLSASYQQLFRGYDRDHDGVISFKDFLRYHHGVVFSTDNLFDIVFDMYDADGGGLIERWELEEVVTNSTRLMGKCDVESKEVQDLVRAEVAKIMSFVDEDGDGCISKDEMKEAAKKHPELLEKLKNLS